MTETFEATTKGTSCNDKNKTKTNKKGVKTFGTHAKHFEVYLSKIWEHNILGQDKKGTRQKQSQKLKTQKKTEAKTKRNRRWRNFKKKELSKMSTCRWLGFTKKSTVQKSRGDDAQIRTMTDTHVLPKPQNIFRALLARGNYRNSQHRTVSTTNLPIFFHFFRCDGPSNQNAQISSEQENRPRKQPQKTGNKSANARKCKRLLNRGRRAQNRASSQPNKKIEQGKREHKHKKQCTRSQSRRTLHRHMHLQQ